jgi:molecular chaperone GrpE (heat shock protein)
LDKILPVLDDLERAQGHLNDAGLGHVIKQFHQVLSGEGLSLIESDGADFDPETMDCAEVVAGPKDKVVKTISKGYRYYDKVLRPAGVEVGNGVADAVGAIHDAPDTNAVGAIHESPSRN